MAIDLKKLSKSRAIRAPRALLYGVPKIGKSTTAANADAVIYQACEDCGPIESTFLPYGDSFDRVIENLTEVYTQEHEFKNYVLDSLSALERLIWDKVAKDNKKTSIEDIGYGKGYQFALEYWKEFLNGLDAIRNERGMGIIMIAHSDVEKFSDPLSESYHQYQPALHKTASSLIRQWADMILFCNYQTFIKTEDGGFGKKTHKGVGTGVRLIYTEEQPAYLAGNRYGLPQELSMNWEQVSSAVQSSMANKQSNQPTN